MVLSVFHVEWSSLQSRLKLRVSCLRQANQCYLIDVAWHRSRATRIGVMSVRRLIVWLSASHQTLPQVFRINKPNISSRPESIFGPCHRQDPILVCLKSDRQSD